MKKQIINKFGVHYLLGVNQYGEKVYLEKESWDCGWYWGFGYLHTFTNNKSPMNSRDIASHTHFDYTFLKQPNKNGYDAFKEYFKESVLQDSEKWELIDLMKSAYTMQESAEVFGRGYSHYTEKGYVKELKNEEITNKINQEILPKIFERIHALLTPKGENEQC